MQRDSEQYTSAVLFNYAENNPYSYVDVIGYEKLKITGGVAVHDQFVHSNGQTDNGTFDVIAAGADNWTAVAALRVAPDDARLVAANPKAGTEFAAVDRKADKFDLSLGALKNIFKDDEEDDDE